jgi:hypothetical protein
MTDDALEFRKVKALEDIEKIFFDYSKFQNKNLEDIVDYMRRMDDMMQSLIMIMQRIEDEVGR